MLRSLLFFLALAGLSFIAAWFADHPGSVSIVWMGYRVDTTFFFLAVLLTLLLSLLLGSYALAHALLLLPRRMRERRAWKYRARGLDALAQTFVALASDDAATAKLMLQKADRLLSAPDITLLLSAQLAKLQGDEARTRQLLEQMLQRKETAFIAARGLLEHARSRGAAEEAIGYARRAAELRPKDPRSARALIETLLRAHRWQEALQLAEKSRRSRLLSAEESRRILAVLYYSEGKRIAGAGDRASALHFLRKAHKERPEFVPAAALLAALLHASGHKAESIRALRRCWALFPHPDIVAALQVLYPDDTPEKWSARIEKFTQGNPEHPESRLALARAALKARRWQSARKQLGILLSREETADLCRLMAGLETEEKGDAAKASDWLSRAASADPGPAWVCSSCGHAAAAWESHCPRCCAFDSLQWTRRSLKFARDDATAT